MRFRNAVFCLLVVFSLACPAAGQSWLQGKWRNLRQVNKMLAQKEASVPLTNILVKRAALARDLQYHWQSQDIYHQSFMEDYFRYLRPVYTVGKLDPFEELDARLDNAWVYANNRRVLSSRMRLEQAWRRLQRLMPQMEKDLRISFKQALPAIPSSAKYVFLGEVHGSERTKKLFLELILKYQEQNPGKQIILLTEFQHDKGLNFTPFNEEERFEDFKDFFDALVWHYIPFAGLEESYASLDERQFIGINGAVYPAQRTGEGMRLRNAYWVKRIRAWAEKYPQAVFFIYAGNGHVDYQVPFSVSGQLPQGETFVFSVYKNPQFHHIFHAASQGRFASPGALLTWNNPRWGRISGFDAAYILPKQNY